MTISFLVQRAPIAHIRSTASSVPAPHTAFAAATERKTHEFHGRTAVFDHAIVFSGWVRERFTAHFAAGEPTPCEPAHGLCSTATSFRRHWRPCGRLLVAVFATKWRHLVFMA
jgi:hypothetical protein